jgi:hypothetical protein
MIPIIDYEDQYTITELGEVTRIETQRRVKHCTNIQNGYSYVSLWKNNVGRLFTVHRLVARHFIPNPHNKPHVNHLNSIRTDARKSNLEWCTQSENMQHARTHGFLDSRKMRIFNDFELDILLTSFLSGITMTAIAKQKKVGLSRVTINLRRRATENLQLQDFIDELRRQKVIRNNLCNKDKAMAVLQWTLDGEFIQEHASMSDAARALGKESSGTISNALNPYKSQEKAYGYRWTFK